MFLSQLNGIMESFQDNNKLLELHANFVKVLSIVILYICKLLKKSEQYLNFTCLFDFFMSYNVK